MLLHAALDVRSRRSLADRASRHRRLLAAQRGVHHLGGRALRDDARHRRVVGALHLVAPRLGAQGGGVGSEGCSLSAWGCSRGAATSSFLMSSGASSLGTPSRRTRRRFRSASYTPELAPAVITRMQRELYSLFAAVRAFSWSMSGLDLAPSESIDCCGVLAMRASQASRDSPSISATAKVRHRARLAWRPSVSSVSAWSAL